jgi:hypothetical protein
MLPREPRRREFSSLVATLLPRKTRGDLLQTQKLLQLAIAICDFFQKLKNLQRTCKDHPDIIKTQCNYSAPHPKNLIGLT